MIGEPVRSPLRLPRESRSAPPSEVERRSEVGKGGAGRYQQEKDEEAGIKETTQVTTDVEAEIYKEDTAKEDHYEKHTPETSRFQSHRSPLGLNKQTSGIDGAI